MEDTVGAVAPEGGKGVQVYSLPQSSLRCAMGNLVGPGLISEAGATSGEPSSACMGPRLPPCVPSRHLTGTVAVVASLVIPFRAYVAALSHKDTESGKF